MTSTVSLLKLKALSKLPSVSVVATIIFLYYMYMQTFLVPLMYEQNRLPKTQFGQMNNYWDYVRNYKVNRSTIYFIVVHYLMFWFIISYMRVIFTLPGFVPKDWNEFVKNEVCDEYLAEKKTNSNGLFSNLLTKKTLENFNYNNEDFREYVKKTGRRFCTFCQNFKPERTHHCRQTGRCVLKMDHYCNWISNCIGFKNYKFFLVFILYCSSRMSYSALILLFLTITYTECLYKTFENPRVRLASLT